MCLVFRHMSQNSFVEGLVFVRFVSRLDCMPAESLRDVLLLLHAAGKKFTRRL
jgi:hypothetical protein